MRPSLFSTLGIAFLFLLACGEKARGQEAVVSPASGFLRVTCAGGSDTRVSVPFHPTPEWGGPLLGAPTSPAVGIVQLSMTFPVGITAGDFAATPHHLFCKETSSTEGRHFEIVAHGVGTVDVAANLVDFAGLGAGARFEIFAAWTLDTLFPPGQQTVFFPSMGLLATGRGSELLFFNHDGSGIRRAPSRRFLVNEDGWLEVGAFTPAGDVVLPPGQPFIVRHPAGSGDSVFTTLEQVYDRPVRLPVKTVAGKHQDATLAPPRPVALALADLDFGMGIFTESTGTDVAGRGDELLVFDNSTPGINQAPSATYFRLGGQWIADSAGFPVADTLLIEPSAGLILRKAVGAADLTLQWVNLPSYDLLLP